MNRNCACSVPLPYPAPPARASSSSSSSSSGNDGDDDKIDIASSTSMDVIIPSSYVWPTKDMDNPKQEEQKHDSYTLHGYPSPPRPLTWISPHGHGHIVLGVAPPPVIDMHQDLHHLIHFISWACLHWGFFYLVNHGIPLSLLHRMRSTASHLFSLPLPTKLKASRVDGSFEGFGQPLIGKFFQSRMWSEGFTVMGHPSSSIATITSKLCGPETSGENGFRDVFEEYDMAMKGLAGKLLWAIIQGMGVEMEEFKCKQFDPVKECNGALQLNYYPPCPQPEITMGLAAHTDSTCLTILEQGDSVPGLQMYRHGSWISTPPVPGSLVIHVGDMLQVLSNGKYESILHRAITNKENSRLSLAYLCGPPFNATISPCYNKEMGSMNNDPIYKPLTWKEYLQAKSEYFLDALDYFKCK